MIYSYSTKKRGRPFKFNLDNSYINKKKESLFGSVESHSEHMNIVNLAYHTNKITSKEKDLAGFLELLSYKVKKGLGVKKIPSSSPNTWNTSLQSHWNIVGYQDQKAENYWNKITSFLKANKPEIYGEFISIIDSHHSYEELLALKFNANVMNTLKEGLQLVQSMVDSGCL